MVASIGSTSTNIDVDLKKLASGFQAGIQAEIDQASQPIKRIQTQRDTVDVRRGVFADMKSNFDALQSAVQALITTQATYGLKMTPKATVTAGLAGSSVLTATSGDSAALAEYDIAVTHLAKAQTKSTDAFASADMALGKSGMFWLGGSGTASVSDFSANSTVTAASASAVASGQRELGTGSYSIQTRISDGVRQFRLVNADGTAVSIRKGTDNSFTDAWQAIPSSGSYNTGRGLSLNLSSNGMTASTSLTYNAQGVSINIGTSDTLRSIVSAINAASQPDGRDMKASIVGNKLVIAAAQTGANHSMLFTDGANLGFGADLQPAQDAVFSVNGLSITRSRNSNLSDVIDGVTLNLAGDAEGKTAHLSVAGSSDNAGNAMNTLVSKFNAAFSHLTNKLAVTSKTEGVKTTYTRGPLTGDIFIKGLRTDLYYQMSHSYTNSGSFKRLTDIGLSFDKDMKLSLDSVKFNDAMKNHSTDVTALLDAAMGSFNTMLSRQTGTSGSLQTTLTSLENQVKDYDAKISKKNESLTTFKQSLYDKYLNYQMTLADLGNLATEFGINLTT